MAHEVLAQDFGILRDFWEAANSWKEHYERVGNEKNCFTDELNEHKMKKEEHEETPVEKEEEENEMTYRLINLKKASAVWRQRTVG